MNKSDLLATIFRHLDGIVTAPSALALHHKGVLDYLLENKEVSLQEVASKFKANDGYLNVALRALCSQGWLVQQIDNSTNEVRFQINERSSIAFSLVPLYSEAVELMKFSGKFHPRKFEIEPFQVLDRIMDKYKKRMGLEIPTDPLVLEIQQQILTHIEGVLVGPTIVLLGMKGMFHKYFMETSFGPEEFHESPESFRKILEFFQFLGWFNPKNHNFQFTPTGVFFAKRASAYGVTVSYILTLRNLDALIFGNPNVLRDAPESKHEQHVDREMNVWGSGGAHAGYFKVIDEIIIELFNRPIDEQPKGILDMGCGNGAFLEHIFEVIDRQTARGKVLDQYPLFLVGADYNQAALKITRENLIKADIWAKVIWGDIGDPDRLSRDLRESFDIDLVELLNVRTFLDHNRIWQEPEHKTAGRVSDSTGAFAFRGRRLNNNDVEESLREHFQKWTPYLDRFGLLLIELHTIAPELTAANLGKTAATAYDATHGYSDQYIVEIEVFHKMAREAGLFPDMKLFRRFPDSDIATVSINLLKGATA